MRVESRPAADMLHNEKSDQTIAKAPKLPQSTKYFKNEQETYANEDTSEIYKIKIPMTTAKTVEI